MSLHFARRCQTHPRHPASAGDRRPYQPGCWLARAGESPCGWKSNPLSDRSNGSRIRAKAIGDACLPRHHLCARIGERFDAVPCDILDALGHEIRDMRAVLEQNKTYAASMRSECACLDLCCNLTAERRSNDERHFFPLVLSLFLHTNKFST